MVFNEFALGGDRALEVGHCQLTVGRTVVDKKVSFFQTEDKIFFKRKKFVRIFTFMCGFAKFFCGFDLVIKYSRASLDIPHSIRLHKKQKLNTQVDELINITESSKASSIFIIALSSVGTFDHRNALNFISLHGVPNYT